MKEDRLIYLLESLLGKSKSARGGDEAVFSCPNCNHHKKKLTLNKLTQKYQCWVCGFKGARALQLLKFIKAPYTAFQELKEIDGQFNFKTAHVENVENSEYLANFLNDKTTNEVIYRMSFDNKKKLQEFKEKLDKQKSIKKINIILN